MTTRRVVGWVKFDGDEYYDFRYQTPVPTDSQIALMESTGWVPVYVDEPARPSYRFTPSAPAGGIRTTIPDSPRTPRFDDPGASFDPKDAASAIDRLADDPPTEGTR